MLTYYVFLHLQHYYQSKIFWDKVKNLLRKCKL